MDDGQVIAATGGFTAEEHASRMARVRELMAAELAADVVAAADGFSCDSMAQSRRLGELRAALEAGFDASQVVELGSVVAGDHPGRAGDDQVTICDLSGTGAQDTAIASLAVDRCRQLGAGLTVET